MRKFTQGFIFKLKMENYSFDANTEKILWFWFDGRCLLIMLLTVSFRFIASHCIHAIMSEWLVVLIKRFVNVNCLHFSFKLKKQKFLMCWCKTLTQRKSLRFQCSKELTIFVERSKSHWKDDFKWKPLIHFLRHRNTTQEISS